MAESVKCPHCGTINPAQTKKCRLCGMMISDEEASVGGVCISCGAKHPAGTEICNSCGMPVRELVMRNLPKDIPAEECDDRAGTSASMARTSKISVAGVMILVAGVLGIVQAVLSLMPGFGEDLLNRIAEALPGEESVNDLLAEYVVLQILLLLMGIIAVFGSFYAIRVTRFDVALIGAVCGILAIGFFVGSALSLIGLIVLVTSRKGFLAACS